MPLNRVVIWTANVALAVLCCWLAAGVASDVAGAMLAPAPSAEAEAPPVPSAAPRSWESRRVILDRNLFNSALLAPAGEPEPAEDLADTKLPLKLLGTAAGAEPRFSWAAVEDLEKRQHLVVRVGDRLQDKADVVRIERRRLVLRNGGRMEALALDEEAEAGKAVSATPSAGARGRALTRAGRPGNMEARANAPTDRVQRLSEDRFGVAREDVQAVANNPATLFSQARILPKYQEGKMVGVQLNAIQAGSLFEQIGVRNGDTITELNGIQITSQQDSANVLRQLTESTEFNVTVTGADGQERRLTYELR
jgi:general secretion pathway protein C